jgi:hypothetical protein
MTGLSGPIAGAAEVRGTAERDEHFGSVTATGDFDGDGYADLAVGVPDDKVRSASRAPGAGAVNVIYGSSTGLRRAGNQLWTQDQPGVVGVAGRRDSFGAALAAGDFDGDGYQDLAIGVPGEGSVHVLFGSPAGLTAAGDRRITGAGFGLVLAAGDFGHDQRADLAIAAPYETYRSAGEQHDGAGRVHVFYGSRSGPSTTLGEQVWSQESPGIADHAEDGDSFGLALTSGNFGHGRRDDLAVGVPMEGRNVDGSRLQRVGAVQVIYGSRGGLRAKGSQVWTQDSPRIRESGWYYDQFGAALTAANFGNGAKADLAIGVPDEDIGSEEDAKSDAGVVHVIYGSRAGLRSAGNQVWSQDSPGIREVAQSLFAGERFGISLASGRLDTDGPAELAVGVCEGQATEFDFVRGAAHVIRGSSRGLHAGDDELWTQNSRHVPGRAEFGDDFACAYQHGLEWTTELAAGDFGNGIAADLAIGVNSENPRGTVFTEEGAVNVIYGARIGLRGAGSQLWHQTLP